jgi:hypothetical protein
MAGPCLPIAINKDGASMKPRGVGLEAPSALAAPLDATAAGNSVKTGPFYRPDHFGPVALALYQRPRRASIAAWNLSGWNVSLSK